MVLRIACGAEQNRGECVTCRDGHDGPPPMMFDHDSDGGRLGEEHAMP